MPIELAEATKLLEAREAKLVEICRTNLSLQEHEERDQLRAQLFTVNASSEQTVKRAYGEQEKALRARCARLESSLTDKETQLADLLAEGNRMAQEQLKTNNLVKTQRSKMKTLELEKEKISDNLTKAQTEIGSLKSEIATLRENEKRLQESLNQLSRKNLKLEKDVVAVMNELDSPRQKVRHSNVHVWSWRECSG
ncbi:hypothetical protein ECG_07545 [Echinococcus granulosus]|nr:hypothetical protein ECG_07545 [Echinococcus granulosus]